jgi:ribonuclease Z
LHGVDLLYHEATFAESEKERAAQTYHSTARQAAQVASEACVKRLLIGHYSSRYETPEILLNEARELFPETICAKEGMVVSID